MSAAQQLRQEGMQEGIQQGRQEGMQEGILTKAREVARNMLKEHLTIPIIQKVTGLSKEELEKLKK